jgi:hypothetical protein
MHMKISFIPTALSIHTLKLFFDVHVTVHSDKFLIMKPTRCTNFSNLLLKWNSTWFKQFLCPSSGVFLLYTSNGICYTGLLTACSLAHKLSANLYDIYQCCVYSIKLLMMDRGTVRTIQSFIPRINLRNLCI